MTRFFGRLRLDEPQTGTIVHRGALGVLGVIIQSTTRVLTFLIIGRIGGPVVLGVVASAIATAQLLSLLWPSSAGSAATRFVSRSRGRQDFDEALAVAGHLKRRTLLITTLLACCAIPIWMVTNPEDAAAGFYVALLVAGYSGYGFTRGLQFGCGQVTRATIWDVTTGTLGLAGVLLALVLGVRGLGLLMPLAAASLIFTFGGWPWGAREVPHGKLRREIDRFVLLASAGTIASAGFLQLSTISARVVGGAAGAGQYAAALTFATPLAILASATSLVLYPSLSEAVGRRDRDGVRRQTDQATRFLTVAMVSIVGILALCSRSVISIVWGPGFKSAALVLPILLIAMLVSVVLVPSSNALTSGSQRGAGIAAIASNAGLAVGVAVWLAAASTFGVRGIAAGYLAGVVTIATVTMGMTWKQDKHRWSGLIVRILVGALFLTLAVIFQQQNQLSYWLDPVLAAGFCVAWLALSRKDLRLATELVTVRIKK